MVCAKPPELEETVLFAYLDGETNEEVVNHLEACSHCRGRTEHLSVLERRLRAGLFRADCPSALSLGRFHLDDLPVDERNRISIHLESCPHCQGELGILTEYLSEFDEGFLKTSENPSRMRVAKLRNAFDPMGTLTLVAQRGEMGKPLLFESGEILISLSIGRSAEDPAKRTVFGLMTGTEPRGWVASAFDDSGEVARVGVDNHGNFVLSALQPIEYELIFSREDDRLQIESLDLGD